MPKDRPFIDKYAMIGRPKLSPDSEVNVEVQPQSRSLKELAKFDAQSRVIHCEIKTGTLRLDFSHAIGDKIIVNKRNAIKFARWILEVLNGDNKATNKRVSETVRSFD